MSLNKIFLNIITIAVIVLLPYAGIIPGFGYAIFILLFTWLVLRYSKENFSDIGFELKKFEPRAILVGSAVALLTLAFMQLIFHPVLDMIVSLEYDDAGLNETIRGGLFQLTLMIILGCLIGGVYEEIVFHGFIFTRLEKMIRGKYATQISFIITAILFGIYHVQLGPSGVINAFVVGMVYLALFLYFKRKLWYPIICHCVYNTAVMILIYNGYF